MKELIEQLRLGTSVAKDRETYGDFMKTVDSAADTLERITAELEKEKTGHDSMVIYNDQLIAKNNELQDSFAVSLLRVKQLEAECVALRVDAQRYQWLRNPCNPLRKAYYSKGDFGKGLFAGTMLDSVIDAAIAGEKHD